MFSPTPPVVPVFFFADAIVSYSYHVSNIELESIFFIYRYRIAFDSNINVRYPTLGATHTWHLDI